jgi:4-hydroxythreonine-4-phosphate dehydrogenase
MAISLTTAPRPRIAITLGDQAGIGPELVAKLLNNKQNLQKADIFVLADRSEFDAATLAAGGLDIPVADVAGENGVQILDDNSAPEAPDAVSEATQRNGHRCMYQFQRAMKLWREGSIDALVFAPLNKTSLKKAGMTEEDELRWFAKQLRFDGTTSEINIAGPALWTARVTSHVGVEKVAPMVTKESTLKAIELLNRLRYVDEIRCTESSTD